jgi:hypothetical protein
MKMGNPVAQYDTTITPSSNQQFRFSRYPLTYSAFTNKILEPQGYIELNPDTTFCLAEANITELAAVSDAYFISPNPANNQLEIKCLNSINTIQTVDLIESSGKKLIALVANEKEVTLNISEFVPGVYYVLINGYSSAKIIKY